MTDAAPKDLSKQPPKGLELTKQHISDHLQTVPEEARTEPSASASAPSLTLKTRATWFLRRALRKIYSWPIMGYGARWAIGIARLPNYLNQLQSVSLYGQDQANRLALLTERYENDKSQLEQDRNALSQSLAEFRAIVEKDKEIRAAQQQSTEVHTRQIDEIYEALDRIQQNLSRVEFSGSEALDEVRRRIEPSLEDIVHLKRGLAQAQQQAARTAVATSNPPPSTAAAAEPGSAVSADLELVYMGLEQRLRGDEAEIRRRQSVYLEPLANALSATQSRRLLDLGCGRGEFVRLASENGFEAEGIDLNTIAIQEAQDKGLNARQGDALAALAACPEDSLAAISVFHLIEHIPFAAFAKLVLDALKALEPGGLLILETPNPENLTVGANSFWLDPTHRAPVPSKLAQFLCEIQGFRQVDVLPLNPPQNIETSHPDPAIERLNQSLFGPQDYGILAWK